MTGETGVRTLGSTTRNWSVTIPIATGGPGFAFFARRSRGPSRRDAAHTGATRYACGISIFTSSTSRSS